MSEKADSRVTLCPDGKYRWVYEVPMLKNPSILYDVYKVLGISIGVVWLLNVLLIGCEEGFSFDNLWGSTCVILVVMLILAVIGLIAYVIVAWWVIDLDVVRPCMVLDALHVGRGLSEMVEDVLGF